MSAAPSLCFREASQRFKDKTISEEQYYHNILAHCTGYLHDQDDDEPSFASSSSLQWDDEFAFAVECFMKRKEFVKDITPFEDAFSALSGQNLEAIEAARSKLSATHANFLCKILAFRALQLRRAKVLKYCLDVGRFPYEAYFEDEANRVREETDPLTFKALEESQFRKLYPKKLGGNDYNGDDFTSEPVGRDSLERDEAAATFDEGGRFPVDW